MTKLTLQNSNDEEDNTMPIPLAHTTDVNVTLVIKKL